MQLRPSEYDIPSGGITHNHQPAQACQPSSTPENPSHHPPGVALCPDALAGLAGASADCPQLGLLPHSAPEVAAATAAAQSMPQAAMTAAQLHNSCNGSRSTKHSTARHRARWVRRSRWKAERRQNKDNPDHAARLACNMPQHCALCCALLAGREHHIRQHCRYRRTSCRRRRQCRA